MRTVARHKGQRVGDNHIFTGTHLAQLHAFFIFTGHHAHKCHAVAVFRVHVGLNFKHETGELLFARFHHAAIGLARHRRRCPLHQTIQHMVNAEVAKRGPEEHRRDFTAQEQLAVKLMRSAFHQLQLVYTSIFQFIAHGLIQLRVVQPFNDADFLNGMALTGLVQVGFVIIKVVNAFKEFAAANRPGDRRTGDFQLVFHFIQQLHWIADVTVEFVHKGQDRRVAQTGNFHQLTGAILNAFRGVDNHQAAVHRRQRAVGIFREVFVAGGIQQVNETVMVRELHHGGGNRNPALLFHLHPVRFRVLAGAAAFYRTGDLNRLSEQQHLFSDRRFTGVRVRDNGKSAALGHLLQIRRQRHNQSSV
ncbi:FIG00640947: hypothetical protein [Cronobacter sakazakii 696]|nr:FIG00640947: hypothetical protein [Cronobacter sakazakii 696]